MKTFGLFLTLLFVICVVAVCIVGVQGITGTIEARRMEAEAAKARADAERLATQLDLAQAQAQVEAARGERAVLESAARAVDNNTRLVSWYATRGDLRAVLVSVTFVGLIICGVLVTRLVQGVSNAQDNATHNHD